MLGDAPEVEITLSDKFWTHTEIHSPTMLCVLRERGVERAMLTYEQGAPRFVLRFPGVGYNEAPEFDRQVDMADAIKVYDCDPLVGPAHFIAPT